MQNKYTIKVQKKSEILGITLKSEELIMTKQEIIDQINTTKTCQIKVGETHGFRDIWVVVADNRLFCRQYSFSKNSWRTALLENQTAYLKVNVNTVNISGKIPEDLDEIMESVNEAYIDKYVNRLNYYPDIARQAANLEKHQETTTELILM